MAWILRRRRRGSTFKQQIAHKNASPVPVRLHREEHLQLSCLEKQKQFDNAPTCLHHSVTPLPVSNNIPPELLQPILDGSANAATDTAPLRDNKNIRTRAFK